VLAHGFAVAFRLKAALNAGQCDSTLAGPGRDQMAAVCVPTATRFLFGALHCIVIEASGAGAAP